MMGKKRIERMNGGVEAKRQIGNDGEKGGGIESEGRKERMEGGRRLRS